MDSCKDSNQFCTLEKEVRDSFPNARAFRKLCSDAHLSVEDKEELAAKRAASVSTDVTAIRELDIVLSISTLLLYGLLLGEAPLFFD